MAEQPGLGRPVPVGVIDVAHATVGVTEPAPPNLARQIRSLRSDIRRLKAEVELFKNAQAEKAAAATAQKLARPARAYTAMAMAAGMFVMLRDRILR